MGTFRHVLLAISRGACCRVVGLGWPVAVRAGRAEEAGERGDGFEQQGVGAGLLVGGVAGVVVGDSAAVLGLGGELADPGGHGRVQASAGSGRWAASRG